MQTKHVEAVKLISRYRGHYLQETHYAGVQEAALTSRGIVSVWISEQNFMQPSNME